MLALVASINIEHGQSLPGRLLLNEGVVVLLETVNRMIFQGHGLAAQDLEALLKIAHMLTRFLLMLRKGIPGLVIHTLLSQLRQYLDQFLLSVVHDAEIVIKQVSRALNCQHCLFLSISNLRDFLLIHRCTLHE